MALKKTSHVAPVLVLLAASARPAPAAQAPPPTPAEYLAQQWVRTDLTALAAALRTHHAEHGSWPERPAEAAAAYLQPVPARDPWGSPYAFVMTSPASVMSVGPDGRSGTADDIIVGLEGGAPPPPPRPPAESVPSATPAPMPEPPAIPVDEATAQTTRRLAQLADALAKFRAAHGHVPVAEKIEHLQRWLVPDHLATENWSASDAWGHDLRYRTTDTGSSYTLASAGADGRWEVATGGAGAWTSADSDLIVEDGRSVRWPPGVPAMAGAGGAPPSSAAAAGAPKAPVDPEPGDATERTTWRLRKFNEALVKARRDGHWPESDDAERLAKESGAPSAIDGWGRPFEYLSGSGGKHHVLVSAGADGRFAKSAAAYLDAPTAGGDDLGWHDGAEMKAPAPPPAPAPSPAPPQTTPPASP